jgi:hypothetical protein
MARLLQLVDQHLLCSFIELEPGTEIPSDNHMFQVFDDRPISSDSFPTIALGKVAAITDPAHCVRIPSEAFFAIQKKVQAEED